MSSQKGAPGYVLRLSLSLAPFFPNSFSLPAIPYIYRVLFSASLSSLSDRVVKRGRALSVFLFPSLPSFIILVCALALGLVHPPADVERSIFISSSLASTRASLANHFVSRETPFRGCRGTGKQAEPSLHINIKRKLNEISKL